MSENIVVTPSGNVPLWRRHTPVVAIAVVVVVALGTVALIRALTSGSTASTAASPAVPAPVVAGVDPVVNACGWQQLGDGETLLALSKAVPNAADIMPTFSVSIRQLVDDAASLGPTSAADAPTRPDMSTVLEMLSRLGPTDRAVAMRLLSPQEQAYITAAEANVAFYQFTNACR